MDVPHMLEHGWNLGLWLGKTASCEGAKAWQLLRWNCADWPNDGSCFSFSAGRGIAWRSMGKTSTPVMMRQGLLALPVVAFYWFHFVDQGNGGADVKALGLAGKDAWCSLVGTCNDWDRRFRDKARILSLLERSIAYNSYNRISFEWPQETKYSTFQPKRSRHQHLLPTSPLYNSVVFSLWDRFFRTKIGEVQCLSKSVLSYCMHVEWIHHDHAHLYNMHTFPETLYSWNLWDAWLPLKMLQGNLWQVLPGNFRKATSNEGIVLMMCYRCDCWSFCQREDAERSLDTSLLCPRFAGKVTM